VDLIDPGVLLLAAALDALLGEPAWLYRRVPHPVVLCGHVVAWADRTFNRAALPAFLRRGVGAAVVLALVAGGLVLGWLGEAAVALWPWLLPVEVVLVAMLLAGRSLHTHVRDVAVALRRGGAADGRRAVARIVGRDVSRLDPAGVARAAIETLAENASDGVVAPALFYLLFGLPGLFVYKAVNTADSMIGHKTPRHRGFGWAAARLDDLLNVLPARLTALALSVAALGRGRETAGTRRAWRTARRDAPRHRSPNAGWPEAAMAGALGVRLGGPRAYGTLAVTGGWLGEGRRDATPTDIDAALALYRRALAFLAGTVAALAVVA
jgi:adenosylcobinamide-phosphate synthase